MLLELRGAPPPVKVGFSKASASQTIAVGLCKLLSMNCKAARAVLGARAMLEVEIPHDTAA